MAMILSHKRNAAMPIANLDERERERERERDGLFWSSNSPSLAVKTLPVHISRLERISAPSRDAKSVLRVCQMLN